MKKKRLFHIVIAVALVMLVFAPRVFDLGQFTTADEPRWLARTAGFLTKVAFGQWDSLIGQPHPGITNMWLAGATVFSDNWAVRKLPLMFWQSILVFIAGYVFWRLWGKIAGISIIAVLATNPFFIAHTRTYAMNSLLAIFFLLALGLLLLWRRSYHMRYLVFSGAAGAAAVWSKIPGILIIPLSFSWIIFWAIQEKTSLKRLAWYMGVWTAGLLIASALILPTSVIHPSGTIGTILELFQSDEYQAAHQWKSGYYLKTVIFFSTPLQMGALLAIPWALPRLSSRRRQQLLILLTAAILFVVMMMFGDKKGYRYILPGFVILDAVAAYMVAWAVTNKHKILQVALAVLLLWQTAIVWQLHPYTLAYVNPVTKPWFRNEPLGWGEGLDIAADYLNQKPNAADLRVAVYYNTQFAPYFKGEALPLHQWDEAQPDYAVLYRSMYGRADSDWETDVLQQFENRTPEHVITLSGLEYVWIYPLEQHNES